MKVVNAEYIHFLFSSGFHTVAFRTFSIVVGENSFVRFRSVGNVYYGQTFSIQLRGTVDNFFFSKS